MKEYQVLFYQYEFPTKIDQPWSVNDVIEAFNQQTSYDPYYTYIADSQRDAEQMVKGYMADHVIAPYIERTNNELVVLGEVIEIIEKTDDEITYSNLYTKGMEDDGE